MADIRSNGIFGDKSSGGGLHRGLYRSVSSGNGVNVKEVGTPLSLLSETEVHYYWNDFKDTTNDFELTNYWEAGDVGTVTLNPSTYLIAHSGKGALELKADTTDGDGNGVSRTVSANALLQGFTPTANKVITYECYVASSGWDANHWFVGLYEDVAGSNSCVDTNGDMLASKEFCGFHYNDDDDTSGTATLLAAGANNTEVTTTQTNSISAGVDDTFRRFGFRINGTTGIEWYVDGTFVGSATLASAYTAPLYVVFASVNNSSADDTFQIDWVLVSQTR